MAWLGRAGLSSAAPRVRCTCEELAGASAPVGGEDHCPRSTGRRRAMRAPAAARLPGHVVRPSGRLMTGARVRGGLVLVAEAQDRWRLPHSTFAAVCRLPAARPPRATDALLPSPVSLRRRRRPAPGTLFPSPRAGGFPCPVGGAGGGG